MLLCFILIFIAVFLVLKGIEVRFVLLTTALLIGAIYGSVFSILDRFLSVMGDEKIIGPICSGMGFAYVIKITGCDREMVKALVKPIQKIKWALLPAGLTIGYVANSAITSQTAAAAAVGPILIPLMVAAGWRPITAGLTLLMGCSLGGNLLNPGEADIVAIKNAMNVTFDPILRVVGPPALLSLVTTILVFCAYVYRREPEAECGYLIEPFELNQSVNWLQAILPVLPITFMLTLQPQFNLIPSLTAVYPAGPPVSHVMIFCMFIAILIHPRKINVITKNFYEGIGQGFIHVITLIITASCFIKSLELAGVIDGLLGIVKEKGALSILLSSGIPAGLSFISGTGTAVSVSFSNAILPHLAMPPPLGDPETGLRLGTLAAITSSIGRTLSPVAAIVLFCSTLIQVSPLTLVKKAAPTLLITLLVVTLYYYK